jgi:hypothetical protein
VKGSAGYGVEVDSSSTTTHNTVCDGPTESNVLSSNQITALAYGVVPVVTLGLDPEMGEDGFGTKFSYISDKRFSHKTDGLTGVGFEITQSMPNETQGDNVSMSSLAIQTSSPSDPASSTSAMLTNILPNQTAIFALISHGANKFGGYNARGTASNAESNQVDERNNGRNWECDDGNNTNNVPAGTASTELTCVAGTTNYDRGFVSSSSDSDFDDIVLFKTKTQLVKDAGLEFIMCNQDEADTTAADNVTCGSVLRTWDENGNYGDNVYDKSKSCIKICGKYGLWSGATQIYGVGMELIEEQTLTTNQASVTFSNIPSKYKHLEIRATGRSTTAGTIGTVGMQLNGDTGSNYYRQFIRVTNNVAQTGNSGLTADFVAADWHGAGSVANRYGSFETTIVNYQGNFYKSFTSTSTMVSGDYTSSLTQLWGGSWEDTSAITSIRFFSKDSGEFAANSSFSLYGIY